MIGLANFSVIQSRNIMPAFKRQDEEVLKTVNIPSEEVTQPAKIVSRPTDTVLANIDTYKTSRLKKSLGQHGFTPSTHSIKSHLLEDGNGLEVKRILTPIFIKKEQVLQIMELNNGEHTEFNNFSDKYTYSIELLRNTFKGDDRYEIKSREKETGRAFVLAVNKDFNKLVTAYEDNDITTMPQSKKEAYLNKYIGITEEKTTKKLSEDEKKILTNKAISLQNSLKAHSIGLSWAAAVVAGMENIDKLSLVNLITDSFSKNSIQNKNCSSSRIGFLKHNDKRYMVNVIRNNSTNSRYITMISEVKHKNIEEQNADNI